MTGPGPAPLFTVDPHRARRLARWLRRLARAWAVLVGIGAAGAVAVAAVPVGALLAATTGTVADHGAAGVLLAVLVLAPAGAALAAGATLPLFALPLLLEHVADAAVARGLDHARASTGHRPASPADLPRVLRPGPPPPPAPEPGWDPHAPQDSTTYGT